MQNEYDTMVKEDELLAAALQEQEHDQRKADFREIMDMELAMALYKQDQVRTNSLSSFLLSFFIFNFGFILFRIYFYFQGTLD